VAIARRSPKAHALTTEQLVIMMLSVLCGAATQRITGLGFALVSSPLLVLVLGPFQGVLLANLLTLITNIIVLASTWRDVEIRRVLLLAIPALCAVPAGAWLSRELSASLLMIVIGFVVCAALIAVLVVKDLRLFHGRIGAVFAGALSGFMNVTAGVGGPAITLYALSTGWEFREFVASIQVYFAIVNTGSIIAKGLPSLSSVQYVSAFAALGVGVLIGQALTRVVSAQQARGAVIGLALCGSAATVVKGLLLAV